jgi:hypothetical protein
MSFSPLIYHHSKRLELFGYIQQLNLPQATKYDENSIDFHNNANYYYYTDPIMKVKLQM